VEYIINGGWKEGKELTAVVAEKRGSPQQEPSVVLIPEEW
jgi:hypothetical protein